MFEHVLITKFRLVISDHVMQHSCGVERKSEKRGVYAYNHKQLRNYLIKSKKKKKAHRDFIILASYMIFFLKISFIIAVIIIVFVLKKVLSSSKLFLSVIC